MNESFKINVYFDEKGEKLEKLISYFLINKLDKKVKSPISKFA